MTTSTGKTSRMTIDGVEVASANSFEIHGLNVEDAEDCDRIWRDLMPCGEPISFECTFNPVDPPTKYEISAEQDADTFGPVMHKFTFTDWCGNRFYLECTGDLNPDTVFALVNMSYSEMKNLIIENNPQLQDKFDSLESAL